MAKAKSRTSSGAWSTDDVRQLKKLFPRFSNAEVAEELGRTVGSVTAKASALGLTKTKKYLKSIGRA